jgi:hypothetical protein
MYGNKRFIQFRFVVAAILLIAAGLKAYQLATAPLPPVVQGSIFTPLLELLNDHHLLMTVITGEILFALVLIAGLWRQWMWLLSLLLFTAFTLVSLMKGWSGESSCGCFGTITVNPWITTGFDLVIVILLVIFRERGDWTFSLPDRKKLVAVLIAWLVLVGPALFAMLSLKQQPHATLGTEFTGADGKKMILLEPETWIGQEFPLFSRFFQPDGSEILKQGTWNVLLVQTDCPKCQEMKAELEAHNAENIALVVVPSRSNERIPDSPFPVFVLDSLSGWFVTTPCVVKLVDGICFAVSESIEE